VVRYLLRHDGFPENSGGCKICQYRWWVSDLRVSRIPICGFQSLGEGGLLQRFPPGYGDQRGIELLVEAGFSPTEAIKIATMNGAIYLGRQDQIGSIAAGKNADLVLIKGNPATRISDIENVEIVFRDGVGYDSQKLLDSVKGRYGQY